MELDEQIGFIGNLVGSSGKKEEPFPIEVRFIFIENWKVVAAEALSQSPKVPFVWSVGSILLECKFHGSQQTQACL